MTAHVPTPALAVKDGTVFANSRDVAEAFGKRHDNVLKDIQHLLRSEEVSPDWFRTCQQQVKGGNGAVRTYQTYDMTRDGFTLLVMGYTGPKAMQFKTAYIRAFNDMEASLKANPPAPEIDVRDQAQLTAIATQLIEVNRELETRAKAAEADLAEAKPKAEFHDQFVNSDGLYGLQAAARVLNEPPNKFVKYLKRNGYLFYQGGSLVPYAVHRPKGIFEVKATIIDEKARYRTYITPEGIRFFADLLDREKRTLFDTGRKSGAH